MAITNLATAAPSGVNFDLMRGLLSAAKKKLPFFNGTLPGTLSMNMGAPAVKWERINNLAITKTALGETTTGSTRAFQNGRTPVVATVSVVTATPLKYGNFIDMNEEVDLIQMNLRGINYMNTLGGNAGESLNELMIDIYQSTTTNRFGSAVASAGAVVTALSSNDIKYAVNQLNRNSALTFQTQGEGMDRIDTKAVREAFYGICHPDVEEDLRALAGFVGVEQYAGYMESLIGEIGTLNGVRWSTSPLAGTIVLGGGGSATGLRFSSSAATSDVYSSFIYGQEAIGSVGLGQGHETSQKMMYDTIKAVEVIQHLPGSAGAGDPMNEFGTLAWKAWFAGAVLNNGWVVHVQTGASLLA